MTNFPIDQPVAAREGEVPNLSNLNSYLSDHVPGVNEVLSIKQFPSGYSNLTFCITTFDGEFILRRPPVGANIKSAHDMAREFRVLSMLKKHYDKVPNPVIYCDSEDIIGAPFYIMERIQGVILRAANARKLSITPETFNTLSKALVDNLVELHSLDIHSTGLNDLGKPEGYVQRQVEGWIKRYYQAETDALDDMNLIAAWLGKNPPNTQSPTFLHNDYKYDNLVLDQHDLSKVIGMLDWEMATVGDPLMDLGACLAYWSEASDDLILQSFNLTALPGNISRKEFIERYSAKSKRDVSNILFYYVFGLFKNAVIAQQIYARWKQGFSKDSRFGELLVVIKSLAKHAINSLNKQKV